MDVNECMIVDLDKRGSKEMFITSRVDDIFVNRNGLWTVKFHGSYKMFNYNVSRLLYMQQPSVVDFEGKGIYINKKRIDNISELIRFNHGNYIFYHVVYSNGFYEDLDGINVYVTRTPIDKNDGSVWGYLNKLSEETGLLNDDDESILTKQYEKIDVKRDNVPLAQYLGDKRKLLVYKKPKLIYYPFGCNASQKNAVEAALSHQISVIQGPPGTGKTQTILNIIANLLIAEKTVLVVSNNNSAVENVVEKLSKEGLDFLVAKLGSSQNKEEFIANQPVCPSMDSWIIEDAKTIKEKVVSSMDIVTRGFDGVLRRAQLSAERSSLLTERQHNASLNNNESSKAWLERVSSSKLLKLLNESQNLFEKKNGLNVWFRLGWSFRTSSRMFSFLGNSRKDIVSSLESAYYESRLNEVVREESLVEESLKELDLLQSVAELRSSSLLYLKHNVSKQYRKRVRSVYRRGEIISRSEDFLKDYPIVLSTTYSAKSCIDPKMVFDYVIMDEASQVDIKTGALALSCALNAVIVGDDKQLPNVVGREEAVALQAIQEAYQVGDEYDAVTKSFLQSCLSVFSDAPVTLLREHYRCHPKIIEFCNQKFYNGELVPMTSDDGESNVLQVVYTGKGNYARGHLNQREIDVIVKEVMPCFSKSDSVGIITPYRQQAEQINLALGMDVASTVHKFQGRECDAIILSMVDNEPTEFSDDSNLLNVAISRAKTNLCVVTNELEKPQDSILGQLIAYMKYNNCNEKSSSLQSVFDLLYKPYTLERLAFEKSHLSVSEYLSENLVYDVLKESLKCLNNQIVDVLCHYPLSRLVPEDIELDEREIGFVESSFSHVDFLVYNSLTKQALLVIEVDGWRFHAENKIQKSRDGVKDGLLKKCGLPLIRISTTDTLNVDVMKSLLEKIPTIS